MLLINKVNNFIKTLAYTEYAENNMPNSNYIDLRHGSINYSEISNRLNQQFNHIEKSSVINYRYSQDKKLLEKISLKEKIPVRNIIITDGADSALHHVTETFLSLNKKALISVPSFPRTEFHVKIVGSKLIFVNIYGLSEKEKLKYISLQLKKNIPDVVFLESPNNPTGETFSSNQISKFLTNNPYTIVVIDQSLCGYYNDSLSNLTTKYSNLIVIKSFSKLLGLPGLRIGYIIASEKLIKYIKKTVSPYELSTFSIFTARKFIRNNVLINFRKKQVFNNFNTIGNKLKIKFSESKGPFLLVDGTDIIPDLYNKLLQEKILTVNGKNFRGLEHTNTVRISLTHYQNIERLIDVINSL